MSLDVGDQAESSVRLFYIKVPFSRFEENIDLEEAELFL